MRTMPDQLSNRPIIPKAGINELMSSAEYFQNKIIRPIIKMKHELLVAYVKNYIAEKHVDFITLSEEKKTDFILSIFQKDQRLRAEIKGMILGNLTVDEYQYYIDSQQDISKRIIQIIQVRIIDHLDLLSNDKG